MNDSWHLENAKIPAQAKDVTDFNRMTSVGSNAEVSMLASFAIPFVFMIFMSMNMDKVWSMYLMLQISSDLKEFEGLLIPANADIILTIKQ